MNIQDIIRTFKREHIENDLYKYQNPLIVLPNNMYDATKQMCLTNRECRGIMLYKTAEEQFIIRHMINIGYGTSTSVFPDEKKLAAANKLLHRHPELGFIDYHTHTISTGPIHYQNFSSKDIDELIKRIDKNQKYMHVLFTPTNILTCGLNKPYFAITTKSHSLLDEETLNLDREFKEILSKQ